MGRIRLPHSSLCIFLCGAMLRFAISGYVLLRCCAILHYGRCWHTLNFIWLHTFSVGPSVVGLNLSNSCARRCPQGYVVRTAVLRVLANIPRGHCVVGIYAALHCAIVQLCCARLCCNALCCLMPPYAALGCARLHYPALCYVIPHYASLCAAMLRYTALCCAIPHYAALH
jgi:hypothetical protein